LEMMAVKFFEFYLDYSNQNNFDGSRGQSGSADADFHPAGVGGGA
jgi:hypothetical protein